MLSSQLGAGCCSTLTRPSMSGDAIAPWRLVKEFHTFSSCCSRCLLGISTLFPRTPCSDASFWTNFVYLLREKWSRISLQFTLGKFGTISTSSIWQSPRASVYVAFGRISHIFIVLVVPASLRSSHLKIWTLFVLAVIWRWEGVFGGF